MARSLFRLVLAAVLISLCVTQDPTGPPPGGTSIQGGGKENGPPSRPPGDAPPAGGGGRGEGREAAGGGGGGEGGPQGGNGSRGGSRGGPPPGGPEGQAGPDGHGGPPGGGHERGPFMYKPSFSAAAGASILYLILSAITVRQLFGYKTWYFLLLPQAAVGSLVGSIARTLLITQPKAGMGAMMAQSIAWTLPPSLLGIVAIFTFTRVVWWACPDERRTRRVLGVPPHHISMTWAAMFVVPDMAKGVVGNFARPKEGERPDPGALLNRVQSGCWALQFFVLAAWACWALRFMVVARRWPTPVDAAEKRWRELGWATVAVGGLLSVGLARFFRLLDS